MVYYLFYSLAFAGLFLVEFFMTVPVPDQLEFISDGDGVTKEFSYPRRFLQKDEIVVAFRKDNADTIKSLNIDYTVAGSSNPIKPDVAASTKSCATSAEFSALSAAASALATRVSREFNRCTIRSICACKR